MKKFGLFCWYLFQALIWVLFFWLLNIYWEISGTIDRLQTVSV